MVPAGHAAPCGHVSGLPSKTGKVVSLPSDFLCHCVTNITIYAT